jgi:hypothetical protein
MTRVLRKSVREDLEALENRLDATGLDPLFVYLLFCGLPRSIKVYIAVCGADYINDKLTQRASELPRTSPALGPVSFDSLSIICQDTFNVAQKLGIRTDLLLKPSPSL